MGFSLCGLALLVLYVLLCAFAAYYDPSKKATCVQVSTPARERGPRAQWRRGACTQPSGGTARGAVEWQCGARGAAQWQRQRRRGAARRGEGCTPAGEGCACALRHARCPLGLIWRRGVGRGRS